MPQSRGTYVLSGQRAAEVKRLCDTGLPRGHPLAHSDVRLECSGDAVYVTVMHNGGRERSLANELRNYFRSHGLRPYGR